MMSWQPAELSVNGGTFNTIRPGQPKPSIEDPATGHLLDVGKTWAGRWYPTW